MRIALCFLVFFSVQLNAQTFQPNLVSRNEASTIAYWSIGDKKSYHLTRSQSSFKNKKKKPDETMNVQYDLTISVIDSTDSSYLMRMSYRNRQMKSEKVSKETGLVPLDDYFIDYVTDEYGAFDSISNLVELTDLLKTHFSKSIEAVDASDSTKSAVSEITNKLFNNMYILNLFFQKDIILFHSIYGIQLKLESPAVLELEYPPISDVQMLGEGKLTLRKIDKERDFCQFYMTQSPYKEEINKFLIQLINQFISINFDKIDISDCSFTAKSRFNYSMELSSGWMTKITNKSTVTSLVKKKKIKTVVSTLIEER